MLLETRGVTALISRQSAALTREMSAVDLGQTIAAENGQRPRAFDEDKKGTDFDDGPPYQIRDAPMASAACRPSSTASSQVRGLRQSPAMWISPP